MRVLGIDLGLRACGYVICNLEKMDILLLKEEQITPSTKIPLVQKLGLIYEGLAAEIKFYSPEAIVVEKLYSHHRHPVTLGILAQVKGVIEILAYQTKTNIFEYSPTRARKSFLGRGNVNSRQVQKMAENITNTTFKSIHTADAFSLIVAFSHEQKIQRITSNLKYS